MASAESNITLVQGGPGSESRPAATPQKVDAAVRKIGAAITVDGELTRAAVDTGNQDLAKRVEAGDQAVIARVDQATQALAGLKTTVDRIDTVTGVIDANAQIAATEAQRANAGIQGLDKKIDATTGAVITEVQGVGTKVDDVAKKIEEGNQLTRDELDRRRRSEMLDQPDMIAICAKDPVLAAKRAELVDRLRNDLNADPQAAVSELLDLAQQNDPKVKEARILHEATMIGDQGSKTLSELITENPQMEQQIRKRYVDDAIRGALYSRGGDLDTVRYALEQEVLYGHIDAMAMQDVLRGLQDQATTESQKLIARFESGQIATLDELEEAAELFPIGSIVRGQIQEYRRRAEELNSKAQDAGINMAEVMAETDPEARANLLRDMIDDSLDTMPEPGRSIYSRMLETSANQQILEAQEAAAKKATLEAKASELQFNEGFARFKIYAKYFGPTLIPVMLGLTVGIASGNAKAGLWIAGLGGTLTAGAGAKNMFFGGGLGELKHLRTQTAIAQEALAHAQAEGGRLDAKLVEQEANFQSLFAEIRTRQIAAERGGNLSAQQFQALKEDVLQAIGMYPQQQALMSAFEGAMSSQIS